MRIMIFVLLSVIIIGCRKPEFNPEWTHQRSPAKFTAIFETTKGKFEIQVERQFSPQAADRFYQLVKYGYFNNGIFYRVVPGFVAQFGNTDVAVMNRWRKFKVRDEKVLLSNKRGAVSFASAGKDSRDLEVFINLIDNPSLDTVNIAGVAGFPAFGKVTKGLEVVDALHAGYEEKTMSDPNLYLDRTQFYQTYPKLDLIKEAYLMGDK